MNLLCQHPFPADVTHTDLRFRHPRTEKRNVMQFSNCDHIAFSGAIAIARPRKAP